MRYYFLGKLEKDGWEQALVRDAPTRLASQALVNLHPLQEPLGLLLRRLLAHLPLGHRLHDPLERQLQLRVVEIQINKIEDQVEGVIRKIVIGRDPKDAMAYYVGMRAGGGEVSAIIFDEEYMVRYNKSRYLVYLQRTDGQVLWKSVNDMPSIIEYDLNF